METLNEYIFGNFDFDDMEDQVKFQEVQESDEEMSQIIDDIDLQTINVNNASENTTATRNTPPETKSERFASVSETEIDNLLADASSDGTKKWQMVNCPVQTYEYQVFTLYNGLY